MNKKLEWIKEHKKKIIIGSASIAIIGVLGYLGFNNWKNNKNIRIISLKPGESFAVFNDIKNINVKLDSATVTDAWNDDYNGILYPQLILDDFKASDIEKIGTELIKKVPGITKNTAMSCAIRAIPEE